MPNPYITSFQQSQDVSGLQPVYQNMAAQQQFQNQMLQQGGQLAQQAGQTAGAGIDPYKMAAALRKDKGPQVGVGQMLDANGNVVPDPTYGAGNAYNNMTLGEIANMQQYGV